MLFLGNGQRQIKVDDTKTLYVFPDFSDPQQFYYLPNFPHVAKMDDGTPAIRLLVYRDDPDAIAEGEDGVTAFLSLDVDLAWPPEVIERAASKLQVEGQLSQKARLTPIFFHKGTVKLMLLDAETPADGAGGGAPAERSKFVTKIMGAGSPSLYGDNRAIFQASLSKKGAAALSGALDGVTPIGVVYSLTFAGLQPAFKIKARVDWNKVMTHFSEQESKNYLFYEEQIQKSIDKLVDEKVIEIDVTVQGIGAEAMDADREAVMNSVRQMIFDKFFEATFERETAAGDDIPTALAGTLRSMAQDALTFGIGYTYVRKEVTVEELRTLDLDFTARKAAERTIYPQAHMYNLLTSSGMTKEKLITVVNGGDSLWKTLPLEIMAAAAWEADGIHGVTVDVEIPSPNGAPRTTSVFLNKDKPKSVKREWMDRVDGDEFRYKYEVVFGDGSVPGPHAKIASPWMTEEGTVLTVNPRDLYAAHELEVMAPDGFPFARWPAVQAVVRYRTEDGSFEHQEDGVLSAGNKSFKTRFRIDKDKPGKREITLTYMGATGERVERPWELMIADQHVIADPHSLPMQINVLPSGDRANIANLLVDLEYTDEQNGIEESTTISFGKDNLDAPQKWVVQRADAKKTRYRYRMTLVTKTGEFIATDWIYTDARSIPVGEGYVRELQVEFATGELAPTVEAVEVAVRYDDPVNSVRDERTFRLGSRASASWKLLLKDAGKRDFEMTTTWVLKTGFKPKQGPTTVSTTYVVIPGAPPR